MSICRAAAILLPFTLLAACAAPASAQLPLTEADLLNRILDRDRLYQPPGAGEQARFFVWPGRTEGEPPVSHPDEPDGWMPLAVVEGPGVLTRLWTAEPSGHIRLEIDGAAVIDVPFKKLFDGTFAPFGPPLSYSLADSTGSSCYFPIGFSGTCRVLGRGVEQPCEFQFCTWDRATAVKSFTLPLAKEEQDALAALKVALERGLSDSQIDGPGRILPMATAQRLKQRDVLSDGLSGAGIIRALYVAQTERSDPRNPYALHQCVLRIYFDGRADPAIEVPLSAFFGCAFTRERVNGLAVGTNREVAIPLPDRGRGLDEYLYCLLPMPFTDGFRVEIANNSGEELGLLLYLRVARITPPADSLRLHARFRRVDPCTGPTFELHSGRGPGRLVGTLWMIDTPREEAWDGGGFALAADEPPANARYRGVDTAAWFGGRTPLSRFQTALHGCPSVRPYGKSFAVRWLLADDVAYSRNLDLTWRYQPATGQRDAYVGSVTWWYAPGDAGHRFARLQSADLAVPPLRIPNAVEVEGRVRGTTGWSRISQQNAGGAELSGQEAVVIAENQDVEIEIPLLEARHADLKLRIHPKRPFDTVTLTARDGSAATITSDRRPSGIYAVGRWKLAAGSNPVKVRCSQATTLDCWIVDPAAGE